jgi:hypothetical protein
LRICFVLGGTSYVDTDIAGDSPTARKANAAAVERALFHDAQLAAASVWIFVHLALALLHCFGAIGHEARTIGVETVRPACIEVDGAFEIPRPKKT